MVHDNRSELPEITTREHPSVTDDPNWLHIIALLSTALNRLAAIISTVLLVCMTSFILLEIVLRFFSRSTFMADALVGYGVAAITFLAAAWALEEGAMIRVSVITDRLPRRARWATECFTLVSAAALMWFLLGYQWNSVAKLWERGSVSQHYVPIPLWIPEAIFFAGLCLLFFQMVVRFLRLFAVGHADERPLTL